MKKLPKKKANGHYNSDIFSEIYKRNMWGGNRGEFYSGSGSHNPYVHEYAEVIADFITRNQLTKIVEIGCGDFNVTNHICTLLNKVGFPFSYCGYDVVKPLIERNRSLFVAPNIKFVCKDASVGNIISGDVLIIRQVLQHLNNKSIKKIVDKFGNYKCIIVAEHQLAEKYKGIITPNRDKKTDASNRIQFTSGVYLEQEPFNCQIARLLHSIPEAIGGREARINTYLILNTSLGLSTSDN